MVEVHVPQFDANSDSVRLVSWLVADGAAVQKGDELSAVETSKAVYSLHAEASGLLVHCVAEGAVIGFNQPIAWIVVDAAEAAEARRRAAAPKAGPSASGIKATLKAIELAARNGIDLAVIAKRGVITEDDVRARMTVPVQPAAALPPGELPVGVNRVLVITAGLGAMQVIDILLHDSSITVVGCVDDDPALAGASPFGVPVLGKTALIGQLWSQKKFDSAIVGLSSSVPLRKKFFEDCLRLGIPMINAIDPSAKINRGVVLGRGNIICSQVHIGVATRLGDNNFISAHSSIDHHNLWGSHIALGPNCATSGLVTVRDEVRMGMGIFIQPKLEIGLGSVVASGAVILQSIPARHVVKTRISLEMRPLED